MIAFQRGWEPKHTSSALIQCDYDLNHRQQGRQEAQWHRLTMRGVISLVSEKLLTHVITPSPLEKRSSICSNNHANAERERGEIEGGQAEQYNKEEELEHGVDGDYPKCSHSLF